MPPRRIAFLEILRMPRFLITLGLMTLLTASGCCASFRMEPPPGRCCNYPTVRNMNCGCSSCGGDVSMAAGHPQLAGMAHHAHLPGAPRPVSPVQPAARFHPVPTRPVFEPVPDEPTFGVLQR